MKRSPIRTSRRSFTVNGLAALAALGVPPLASAQAPPPPQGKSVSAEVERANVAVVNDFCAAFDRKDLAKVLSLLADNCVYRITQTRPAVVGKEKVSETIKGFIDRVAGFKVLKTVALGPVVVNERDDFFAAAGTNPARTFHVAAGVFFVENGKIVEWTDYVV